ncbi:MAG TPA: tRNA (N6-isopentenyl adenosine(37)-C2)-methylthiotransferase MiaB [Synergistales bacterium]|nr:tRNA (N6-isopentenyl adenosine(37)-C2)-methylthiotransferase MiaB [Synergistales bacterium]
MIGFALKVYGCQMNVYDSDKIRTALVRKGWKEVPEEDARVVIFNGCSIRDKAEHKVWSELGRYSGRWKKEGLPLVAVVGCIAQNIGMDMLSRYPWVRLVAGPRHIGAIPDALVDLLGSNDRILLLDEDDRAFFDLHNPPAERLNPWKAYVTIAHGCDNYCTYCIVPFVRGRFMSRDPEEILAEVDELVRDGAREITLLGQNVNSYGTDFSNGYRFSHLLKDVAAVRGLDLLRFATSHPKDFTPDVVDAMAGSSVICPGINLPIQSGSDRILRKMNRKYDLDTYTSIVELIRERLPEVGLTSDLIVGFPGETEEDFQYSLRALEKFRFDLVHSAAYSPRSGTAAATMDCQLDEIEKKRRLNLVNQLQSGISYDINRSLLGREYSILVDGPAPKGEGLLQGRTPTDKVVIFPGPEDLLGRFIRVSIEEAEHWCLHGQYLETLS